MLQANSVALVTTSVPKAKMRLALGMQAGAQSLGLALGPTLGGLITVTVGWRFVYWFNVPVGIMAVVAARYLLPRTRDFGSPGRFDWRGTSLLAVCTAGLLLALSAAGGLSLPGWAAAGLALSAITAGAGFAVHEARARFPVIPLTMLRSKGLARALGGAVSGYLVLFGPLVLVPQVLGTRPGSEAGVGLLLSALPAGFGVAALTADSVLPRHVGNRQRACSAPSSPPWRWACSRYCRQAPRWRWYCSPLPDWAWEYLSRPTTQPSCDPRLRVPPPRWAD